MSDKKCSYQYTVRRGDSFYLIAHRLGVPLRDLLEANSDVNPARLTVGDVLCIPTASEEASQPAPETRTAAPSVPAEPAAQATPATQATSSASSAPSAPATTQTTQSTPADPAQDAPADLLDHPATGEDPADATPPATVQTPATQAPAQPSCGDGTAYTVAQDETLADIQLAAGLNLHTLQSANPHTDLDALTAGQVLCVPRENIPCPAAHTYTLTQGETLESAALRLNVSVGALLRANPCLAPQDFTGGAVICVPSV